MIIYIPCQELEICLLLPCFITPLVLGCIFNICCKWLYLEDDTVIQLLETLITYLLRCRQGNKKLIVLIVVIVLY